METVYSNPNDARRQSFLVYFNGIEIPAISVTVTSGIWKFPEASITVAPDKNLRRLGREDKVQVAIFYLDTHYSTTPEFRLLFDGELVSWSYRNQSGGRFMEFTAVNHAAILTQLFPFLMTNLDSMAMAATDTSMVGKAYAEFAKTQSVNLLYRGLNVKGNEPIRRPYDFVENIFKSLYEVSDNYVNGSVTQYFFGRWARMVGFHNRWIPSPYLEIEDLQDDNRLSASNNGIFPLLRAVQTEATIRTIAGIMTRIGNEGSYWDLLKHIFSLFHYEVSINPAPAAAAVDLETGKVLSPPDVLEADTGNRGKGPSNPKKPTKLLSCITKPNLAFTIPPMCNVFYPSMIKSFGFKDDYATEPTRIYVSDKALLELFNQGAEAVKHFLVEANTIAYPQVVRDFMERKKANPNVSGYNMLVWPEEFFKGPVILTHTAPQWFHVISSGYLAGRQNVPDELNKLFTRNIYNTYAALEYYRERFGQKYGTISSLFNPYVVAGFPGVVFDNLDTGMHVNMYVTNIQHTLTQTSADTSVSYTFAQSFEEFFDLYLRESAGVNSSTRGFGFALLEELKSKRDAYAKSDKVDKDVLDTLDASIALFEDSVVVAPATAPAHAIPDIKRRFQITSFAEQYYAALFHRENIEPRVRFRKNKQAAFVVKDRVIVDIDPSSVLEPVEDRLSNYKLSDEDLTYVKSADAAMRAVSRPICTLEEYIDFLGDRGSRDPSDLISADDPQQGKGAPYYVKIADYSAGPGEEPPKDANGFYINAPTVDTRMDWTNRLLAYRKRVLNSLTPFKA